MGLGKMTTETTFDISFPIPILLRVVYDILAFHTCKLNIGVLIDNS